MFKNFVTRRWLPLTAGAVVVAIVVGLGVWWIGRAPIQQPVEAVDCTTLEADDVGLAGALSRACDDEVEVLSERTPWQSSWVAPDGSSRLEASAAPVRAWVDEQWVPVDGELVVEEESIAVAAPVFPMHLNPGGAAGAGQPLATIEREGHLFEIWFPLDLPVPTVADSKVVYELDAGVTLVVSVNADTTGFLPVVRLADPGAADRLASLLDDARPESASDGAGIDLEFSVRISEGLTLTVDESSQLIVTDGDGLTQFFAPPPTMWDSSGGEVTYGSEVTEVGPGDRLVSPSDGDLVAPMPMFRQADGIRISPDRGMLASSETVWPVYLDPMISGWGAAERVAVRTGGYTSTLYNWTDISSSSPGQGTGRCTDVSCNTTFTQRLMWEFQGLSTVASLAGADIQSAQFTVNGVHSYNCNAATTYLWRTSEISPSSTWGNVGWYQQLGSRTESQRPSCGTNGWKTFDATGGFVWAADANSSVIGFGLLADESSMAGWKRFTHDATITVTYNRPPDIPTSLQFTGPATPSCVIGAGRPSIASTTPTLSAIGSDPDLTAVQTEFEVASRPSANLAANSSAEIATTGWTIAHTAGQPVLTNPTAPTSFGTKVIRVTYGSSGSDDGAGVVRYQVPVQASNYLYRFSLGLIRTSVASRLQVRVNWYNGNTLLNFNLSSQFRTTAGATYSQEIAASAPVNATRAELEVMSVNGTGFAEWSAGAYVDVDGLMVYAGEPGLPYVDGVMAGTVWSSGYLTAQTSESRFSTTVPTPLLTQGVIYGWRSRGYDGTRFSNWSDWCEFAIDITPPAIPSVSAATSGVQAVYTQTATRGGVGLLGAFSLSRGSDSSAVSFRYGFNQPTMPYVINAGAGASVMVTYTPESAGPVVLNVQALDAAGNFSPVRTYSFVVADAAADAVWIFDEGAGPAAADGIGGADLRVSDTLWGAGPHSLFDSRSDDFALVFEGDDEVVRTSEPVIDSADSFAMSAHVMLSSDRDHPEAWRTVLAQIGLTRAGVWLGHASSCPGMPDGCWAFSLPDSPDSTTATTVYSPVQVREDEWVHLLAEYDRGAQAMRLWVCNVGNPSNPAAGDPVVGETPRVAMPWAAGGVFNVGSGLTPAGDGREWYGSIDNVRLFSGEVVSEARIRRLCQGAEATDFPGGEAALDPTTAVGG